MAVIYLPFLQDIFKTVALSPLELTVCLGASTLIFWAIEAVKWFKRRRARQR
jgi:Ca2+-transporting ATPase